MATEVKHRSLRWLGHVFRMEQERIPKKGLRLRQKKTEWAKTDPEKNFEKDLKMMELIWGTAEREAKERI